MKEIKKVLIFENERIEDIYPFNILHCGWELRTGAFKQFERIEKYIPESNLNFQGRSLHLDSFTERFAIENSNLQKVPTLAIDSSVLLMAELFNEIKNKIIENSNTDLIFQKNSENLIIYFSDNSEVNLDKNIIDNFKKIELNSIKKINYLWDCLDSVGDLIIEDSVYFEKNDNDYIGFHLLNKEQIYLGKNVDIMPNCVIDAREGAVIIDDNAKIMAQSTIIGPCYIGINSVIKVGAKIYQNTSIGEFCKIGGEVENSIIHSFSNKQHEGFLGHSYICEWVNLGADTNNSDLKNTYSEIKMRLPHKTVKSGKIFLGLMCGDHTKTAINTQFNTGTVAGICGVLFESGFLSTTISSFAWGGNSNKTYKIEDALDTAKKVMQRRNKQLTKSEIELLKIEFDKQINHN